MKIFAKAMERRRLKRLAVIGIPVAIMRPGPPRPGKVTRISLDSVEIVYEQAGGANPAETVELDIFAADFVRPVCLDRLPVKMISDSSTSSLRDPAARKRVLGFDPITPDQRNQLQSFIYSFAY
ncbi:MAG: hypothetical protein EHM37_07900 [Deltaproteobacteria bacterium]|jgi:hypothetical protein|nr:MAG: hypothetical protein EHM37_07900 [Deltaproteobacteria bacterium]